VSKISHYSNQTFIVLFSFEQVDMKLEANRRPKLTAIDISKEPYDHLLSNLKYWKIKDNETIISTLNSLLQYKYRGIT